MPCFSPLNPLHGSNHLKPRHWSLVIALFFVSGAWAQNHHRADRDNMIKFPVSPKTRSAAWPRAGVPEYMFDVRSHGGQPLGYDLDEFDWTLQVDSRRGLISVELFRSDADIPGQPIGIFRQPVDDGQLRDFEHLVLGSNLHQLSPAMQGHPGYTERLYRFESPAQSFEKVINNSDEQLNNAIAPLRNKINSLLGASFRAPERAVQLGISKQDSGFEVSITNVGVEKVCFSDPRSIVASGPLHRAAVMVAELPNYRPGESPVLTWQPVPLPGLASSRDRDESLIVLDSHETWKINVPWKKSRPTRYVAYFTWADYSGGGSANSVYRIRGRADSPRVTIEP
jgi:hypothetical protein